MMKRGIFICLTAAFALHLGAQQISHEVLVGAGSVVSNGDYCISQTLGEPVIKHIGNETYILTQGFQQPSASLFTPTEPLGTGVKVYPNPVKERLLLEFFGERSMHYHVTIFGFNGAIYFKEDIPCSGNFWKLRSLDVSNYQRGTYFVRVVSEDETISRVFKIEKM